jgi:predicted AAA+ superfamily ATPase
LLGPGQVGNTTLAHEIGEGRPSIYLDLESSSDRVKRADSEAYLAAHQDKLVILDELHRTPKPGGPYRVHLIEAIIFKD